MPVRTDCTARIDRRLLIVARLELTEKMKWREDLIRDGVAADTVELAVALPQSLRRGEVASGPLLARGHVDFDDLAPVRGVGESHVQPFRVILGLLHARIRRFVTRFRLHYRERKVAPVAEDIIDLFSRLAEMLPSHRDDPSRCDVALPGDLARLLLPARGLKLRHDVFSTSVGFVVGHSRNPYQKG